MKSQVLFLLALSLANTGIGQNKLSNAVSTDQLDDKTGMNMGKYSNKILFVDSTWIRNIENLELNLNQPKKNSDYPVLAGSYAWENEKIQTRQGAQWIQEEKVWKIWYVAYGELESKGSSVANEKDTGPFTCLATSRDLINWEKPFTRIISYRGSKENNIVCKGSVSGPIYDGDDTDPQHRYKAMLSCSVDGVMGWYPIFSPDGIRWSEPLKNGVLASDETQLIYDEISGEYRFYCKLFLPVEIRKKLIAGRPIQPNNHRCVYLSTSRNFLEWTTPKLVFHADEIDQEICIQRNRAAKADTNRLYPIAKYDNPEQYYTDIYNMAVFNYEGLYIGMPCMFDQTGTCLNNSAGMLYPELACSHDGYEWERVGGREVFLPLGNKENFDSGIILMSAYPVVKNNQIWFYYIGGCKTHDWGESRVSRINTGIGLARLRLDGFVSVDAGSQTGFLTTRAVDVTSDNIWLNLEAVSGEVRAELLDVKSHNPIRGFSLEECIPMSCDSVSAMIRWTNKKNLKNLIGKKILIRLSLKQAKLYSIQIK